MRNSPLLNSLSPVSNLDTPPVSTPVDVEVDLEVLRALPKAFEINSEKTANWLVRKIVAAREYGARAKAWAEQEVRRAEREETTLLFLFGRQIEMWCKSEVEKLGGRRKSLCLPAGTVGFRKLNASLRVDDEDAVVVWAKEHCPKAVIVVEKLSRSELKSHFEQTGEMPEHGAHVEPERESFSIK